MKPNPSNPAANNGGLTPKQQLVLANGRLSQQILQNCPRIDRQAIFTNTQNPGGNAAVGNFNFQVPAQNFGLLTDFFIEINATIYNAGNQTLTPSPYGAAMLLGTVQFYDLNQTMRHNTSGWHLNAVNSAKSRRPYGSAMKASSNDNPYGYGDNVQVLQQSGTIPAAGTGTIKLIVRVPIAYAPDDLRGAILLQLINANCFLNWTINSTIANTTIANDNTFNPYQFAANSNAAAIISGLTVTLYQRCYDQIPQYPSGPLAGQYMVPLLDVSTLYQLTVVPTPAITAGQDNFTGYGNFRSYLSTMFIYDQNGVLNPATDINYIALRQASGYEIMHVDPYLLTLWSRQELGCDWPPAMYYISHRVRPINTIQFGNVQLVMQPSTAAASSQMVNGFEYFAFTATALQAQGMT